MRMFRQLHSKDSGKVYHDGTFKFWSESFSARTPFKYDDGLHFFMSPVELAPWDQWTTKADASPVMPADWEESAESGE